MENFMHNYLGISVMVIGGLVALLGVLLLINHNGGAKVIIGIVLAAFGLGGVGIGYTIDQGVETNYTVTTITALSVRAENNEYRVTLKAENGTETWIYLNDNQLAVFPEGSQVTMTKRQVKMYRDKNKDAE